MHAKLNENQSIIFNALFGYDKKKGLYMRDDAPEEIAFWGGFGSGKSYITMLVAFYLTVLYNASVLFVRYSYPQLKASCIRQFLLLFPPSEYGYSYNKNDSTMVFPGGGRIDFRAFDDPYKVVSSEYSYIIMCQAEELDVEHLYQLYGRKRLKGIPVNGIFLEGNPRQGWCRQRYHENGPPEGCLYIKATTESNRKNLPDGYIENMLNLYPEEWVKTYIEGSWDATSSEVYPELKPHHIIVPRNIEAHWYKCIGLDHGVKVDTSIVFLAKDPEGRVYIYDEWHKQTPTIKEIVDACNTYGPQPIIADYSMKVQDRDYGSWWTDLRINGLNLIEAFKNKSGNIGLVNQMLHQNKLFFFDTVPYVIDQHKNYKYKDFMLTTSQNLQVVKKNDHSCDAVQYAIRHLSQIEVESEIMGSFPPKRISQLKNNGLSSSAGFFV